MLSTNIEILVIEDDAMIADTLQNTWPARGDRLKVVSTFAAAAHLVRKAEFEVFDGIIADVKLPDGCGLDILRVIRSRSKVPFILISGWGSPTERAAAFDLGTDDYVMKPFLVRELQARMARLVLARNQSNPPMQRGHFLLGRVKCDTQLRKLSYVGQEVSLTEAEVRILEALYEQRNMESTKHFLYRTAFFRTYDPRDKTLDVYIGRLRKKLGQLDQESAGCIQTIRGSGYRYSELREH